VVEAVRHLREVNGAIRRLASLPPEEHVREAKELGAPVELVRLVAREGRLPVPNFAAGGVATPADAALMMQLGAESVFVGSGIFKSKDPARRAHAIVRAVTHFRDPAVLVEVSADLGEGMAGLEMTAIPPEARLAARGV
jgi:pyridoxal 5'-phosphate synthase pdxS subunit